MFKYLGSLASMGSGMEAELKHRVGEEPKIMEGLTGLWRSIRMTTDVKTGRLECIMVLIVLYGSES